MRTALHIGAIGLLMLAAACTSFGSGTSRDGIEVTKVRYKALSRTAGHQVSFVVKNTTKTDKIITLRATVTTIYHKALESPSEIVVLRRGGSKRMALRIPAVQAESAEGSSSPALGPYQIPAVQILSVEDAPKF
jgi:hypothetical protein